MRMQGTMMTLYTRGVFEACQKCHDPRTVAQWVERHGNVERTFRVIYTGSCYQVQSRDGTRGDWITYSDEGTIKMLGALFEMEEIMAQEGEGARD